MNADTTESQHYVDRMESTVPYPNTPTQLLDLTR